ncbi:hypothetical protein O3M35_000965 [Rhynocoris fuscipes]|uniref:Fasciclin-2 n=1 Tax=Rhynocoris fuscipes TaxID=488301 RepID=A0AAW1DSL9_9HEMI
MVDASEPELTILPSSTTMPVGKAAVLTCRPDGPNGKLFSDVKWLDTHNRTVGDRNSVTGDRIYVEEMPTDKALALIISSMHENDAGVYTCRGTYANTKVLYKSVHLKTIMEVTWVNAPEEQFPLLGQDYKVMCEVEARPAPRIEWKLNGDAVPQDGRHIIETDGLIIKKVRADDDGIYTCRALVLETGQLQEKRIKVEVHTKPKIRENMPKSLEVVDGEKASITCNATGKPPPTYTWLKGSTRENLSGATDRFSVNERTGVLTITKVARDDNTDFKCIANNRAGEAEHNVRVTVIIKPNVLDIKNISVAVGNEAILECRASGNPLPSITFWKLGTANKMITGIQTNDDRISVNPREDREKGIAIGLLSISPLERKDDGLYACIAKNKGGESMKNGHITVEFPPTFENSPMKEAWTWKRRPVNLTCVAESIPNATITWMFSNRDIERNPNFRKFGNGPQSTLTVTPSDIKFYGAYKCIAKNVHGEAHHVITLQEAHEPSEVTQSTLGVVTATTIVFEFVEPRNTGGRPISAYAVQYKREDQLTWNEAKNKTWPLGQSYILEGLEPQATYNFRFAAANEVGWGIWGAPQKRTMPRRSSPEEPIILNHPVNQDDFVRSPYSDRVELRWKKPADNGEYIDEYQIKYCRVQKVEGEWLAIDTGCKDISFRSTELTSVDVKDLAADTYYKIELRAHNSIGYSTPGQVILKTARGNEIKFLILKK